MAKSDRTPNDQKADRHNETSKEYKDAMDHHSRQLNPDDVKYGGGQQQDRPPHNDEP